MSSEDKFTNFNRDVENLMSLFFNLRLSEDEFDESYRDSKNAMALIIGLNSQRQSILDDFEDEAFVANYVREVLKILKKETINLEKLESLQNIITELKFFCEIVVLGSEVFIVSLIYFERVICKIKIFKPDLDDEYILHTLLGCFIIATKSLEDLATWNEDFKDLFRRIFPTYDESIKGSVIFTLRNIEMRVLQYLNSDIFIKEDVFGEFIDRVTYSV